MPFIKNLLCAKMLALIFKYNILNLSLKLWKVTWSYFIREKKDCEEIKWIVLHRFSLIQGSFH